jgi:hypothetical protein
MSDTADIDRDPISVLVRQVADVLEARPFWSNVPVLTPERGDIGDQMERKIAELGMCAAIEILKGKVEYQAVGVGAISMPVAITISENVLLHRAGDGWNGKTAMSAVMDVLLAFNPQRAAQPITIEDWDMLNDTGGRLVFQVNGTARAGWTENAA